MVFIEFKNMTLDNYFEGFILTCINKRCVHNFSNIIILKDFRKSVSDFQKKESLPISKKSCYPTKTLLCIFLSLLIDTSLLGYIDGDDESQLQAKILMQSLIVDVTNKAVNSKLNCSICELIEKNNH